MHYFFSDHKIIRVTGEKAALFLHGQFSNSISDLPAGLGNYNLFLSSKGKVLADLHVVNYGEFFDVVVDASFASLVGDHLKKLSPLSRCAVETLENIMMAHVFGDMTECLPRLEAGRCGEVDVAGRVCRLFRSDRLGVMGYDVFLVSEARGSFEEFLQKSGSLLATTSKIEMTRVRAGIAKVGTDTTVENLPQESLLDKALHFNKGCYLGQEVIARLHFRGHVNRILTRFVVDGDVPPSIREILNQAGETVGRITSAAFSPDTGKTYLLGYIPVKALALGDGFFAGHLKLRIIV